MKLVGDAVRYGLKLANPAIKSFSDGFLAPESADRRQTVCWIACWHLKRRVQPLLRAGDDARA